MASPDQENPCTPQPRTGWSVVDPQLTMGRLLPFSTKRNQDTMPSLKKKKKKINVVMFHVHEGQRQSRASEVEMGDAGEAPEDGAEQVCEGLCSSTQVGAALCSFWSSLPTCACAECPLPAPVRNVRLEVRYCISQKALNGVGSRARGTH